MDKQNAEEFLDSLVEYMRLLEQRDLRGNQIEASDREERRYTEARERTLNAIISICQKQ